MVELTHKNLCGIAVRWLKRTNSAGGPGCQVAVSEIASGWNGEIPDAIGFRVGAIDEGCVVVEVKTSRADFLSDRTKPHRNGATKGLGNWRYYMCPDGLIGKKELPERFGLLYVNRQGHTKPIVSPFLHENYNDVHAHLMQSRFESDRDREVFLLVKLLARIGDPEKLSNRIKDANNRASFFERELDRWKKRQALLAKMKSEQEAPL